MPLLNSSLHAANQRVTHNWSMAVPAERVWWGLTSPEALPHWLGKLISGRFLVGNAITIKHAKGYVCTSRIQECEAAQILGMTWEFPDEPLSQVRIVLTSGGRSTRLALQHDGLGNHAADYLPGWHTHLLYLEALLLGQPLSLADFWSTYNGIADS